MLIPGAAVTLTTELQAVGSAGITATPTVLVERILSANSAATETTLEPVTLTTGETRSLEIPVTAAIEPGAYRVLVMLADEQGASVSSVAEFRYVVRGISASLVQHELTEVGTRAGETVSVEFVVVGAADRETTF